AAGVLELLSEAVAAAVPGEVAAFPTAELRTVPPRAPPASEPASTAVRIHFFPMFIVTSFALVAPSSVAAPDPRGVGGACESSVTKRRGVRSAREHAGEHAAGDRRRRACRPALR